MNVNDKVYDGYYSIDSSKRFIHRYQSIAVKPCVLGDTINWGQKNRKFTRIEEFGGNDTLLVYLPNEEIITFHKITEDDYLNFLREREEDPNVIALGDSINEYVDSFHYGPAVSKEYFKDEVKKSVDDYVADLAHHFHTVRDLTGIETLEELSLNCDAIFELAKNKFETENYDECLSLFVVLTELKPFEFDYWLRRGVAAQSCNDYPFALHAYSIALILNRECFNAHLFSLECNLNLEKKEEAIEHYLKAENLIAKMPPSDEKCELEKDLLAYADYLI